MPRVRRKRTRDSDYDPTLDAMDLDAIDTTIDTTIDTMATPGGGGTDEKDDNVLDGDVSEVEKEDEAEDDEEDEGMRDLDEAEDEDEEAAITTNNAAAIQADAAALEATVGDTSGNAVEGTIGGSVDERKEPMEFDLESNAEPLEEDSVDGLAAGTEYDGDVLELASLCGCIDRVLDKGKGSWEELPVSARRPLLAELEQRLTDIGDLGDDGLKVLKVRAEKLWKVLDRLEAGILVKISTNKRLEKLMMGSRY
eukprot:187120_1